MARWGDAECPGAPYRWSRASSFRLIVTSRRLNVLAWTADAQVLRLDVREEPQRDIARQKKKRTTPERPSRRLDSRTKQRFDYTRKRFVMSGGVR